MTIKIRKKYGTLLLFSTILAKFRFINIILELAISTIYFKTFILDVPITFNREEKLKEH